MPQTNRGVVPGTGRSPGRHAMHAPGRHDGQLETKQDAGSDRARTGGKLRRSPRSSNGLNLLAMLCARPGLGVGPFVWVLHPALPPLSSFLCLPPRTLALLHSFAFNWGRFCTAGGDVLSSAPSPYSHSSLPKLGRSGQAVAGLARGFLCSQWTWAPCRQFCSAHSFGWLVGLCQPRLC